jgi:uncharacterized membrane protein (DUF373 family)
LIKLPVGIAITMEKFLQKFEHAIVISLLVMMVIAIVLSTLELALLLIRDVLSPPYVILNSSELLEIFGFFLMILIGLELLETIRIFLSEDKVHVEIVFLVALIAIARKVIILDVKNLPSLTLIGIAAIIIALSAGFYVIKKII